MKTTQKKTRSASRVLLLRADLDNPDHMAFSSRAKETVIMFSSDRCVCSYLMRPNK